MRNILVFLMTCIILPALVWSCKAPVTNIDWINIDQKAMIKAMENTFINVAETLKPGILYIEMSRSGKQHRGKVIPRNGIVFKPEGYLIIPGYYKKKGVDRIKVWIDETEYPATIINADKRDNITILKVQTDKSLKPVTIGNSDKVMAGQYLVGVSALGKDDHYEKLITVHMVEGKIEARSNRILTNVSPRYRSSVRETYVVNLNGELIGIFSGSEIVAFNKKRKTAERLIARSLGEEKDIEEQQPWNGFSYAELTKEYAEAWGFPQQGVLVNRVYGDSPAGQAGLKREDVIIAVDDQPITKKGKRGLVQFQKLLDPEINRSIKLKVLRDKSPLDLTAKETIEISFKFDKRPKPKEFTADDIGVQVREIAEIEYLDYNLFVRKGVVVTNVIRGSSAATSSSFGQRLINNRDVILEFYGVPIHNLADFIKAVNKVREKKSSVVLVKLQKGNRLSHVCLNLEIGKRTEEKD